MQLSRPLVAGVTVLVIGSALSAQSASHKVFARSTKPMRSATLDLATGTLTRGPVVVDRGAPTVTDFSNMDLAGFIGVDTGGGFCEWFEAGVKGWTPGGGYPGTSSGNTSDLMSAIVFAYCSAMLTPASGGPGGSVRLGFYEGYTVFGGAPTTTVALLTLTGLPGNSASSSFFGGFTCHFIRVVFGSLVSFADGPIGYSWRFLDNGTGLVNPYGSVLAGTFPFLSCVTSCSGVCAVPDGQGMMDIIDEYCPPGNPLIGHFCFTSVGQTFASISLAIEEVADKTATVAGFNSSTFPNPDTLVADAAVVGATWRATVTRGVASAPGNFSVYYAPQKLLPPAGFALTPTSTWGAAHAGRMLLLALGTPALVACSGTHDGTKGSCSAPIPKRIGLVCNPWNCQAVVLGTPPALGPARLTSAVEGVVGTGL